MTDRRDYDARYEDRQREQGGRLIHVRLEPSAAAALAVLERQHGSTKAAVQEALIKQMNQHLSTMDREES
jgi:hypothetical protein